MQFKNYSRHMHTTDFIKKKKNEIKFKINENINMILKFNINKIS